MEGLTALLEVLALLAIPFLGFGVLSAGVTRREGKESTERVDSAFGFLEQVARTHRGRADETHLLAADLQIEQHHGSLQLITSPLGHVSGWEVSFRAPFLLGIDLRWDGGDVSWGAARAVEVPIALFLRWLFIDDEIPKQLQDPCVGPRFFSKLLIEDGVLTLGWTFDQQRASLAACLGYVKTSYLRDMEVGASVLALFSVSRQEFSSLREGIDLSSSFSAQVMAISERLEHGNAEQVERGVRELLEEEDVNLLLFTLPVEELQRREISNERLLEVCQACTAHRWGLRASQGVRGSIDPDLLAAIIRLGAERFSPTIFLDLCEEDPARASAGIFLAREWNRSDEQVGPLMEALIEVYALLDATQKIKLLDEFYSSPRVEQVELLASVSTLNQSGELVAAWLNCIERCVVIDAVCIDREECWESLASLVLNSPNKDVARRASAIFRGYGTSMAAGVLRQSVEEDASLTELIQSIFDRLGNDMTRGGLTLSEGGIAGGLTLSEHGEEGALSLSPARADDS